MAKKRKKRPSRIYGRRARFGKVDTTSILSVLGGAVFSKVIDKVIPDTWDKKLVAGGKIAVGALLPEFVPAGRNKQMLTNVGYGFMAAGTLDLVDELGFFNGLGQADDKEIAVALEGIEDVEFEDVSENVLAENVLAADDDLSVVNGNGDLAVVNMDNGNTEEEDDDEDIM
jgi:hypothetical protein